jgi:hypothetical protein
MSEEIHFRRCHVCGAMNESNGEKVKKCDHCGKQLAPFYYFDESQIIGFDDKGRDDHIAGVSDGYRPIWGLAVVWHF